MGCNMCMVQKPEEQYRVMFQKGHISKMLYSIDAEGRMKVNGKELSRLSQEQALEALRSSRDPPHIVRRGPRRKAGAAGVPVAAVTASVVAGCVDSGTQTDISFQHILTLGRLTHARGTLPPPPSSPPLPPIPEPYILNELPPIEHDYYDPNDYFDISQHEVDRQDEMEYEEVELYKPHQQDKLGLTVCYRTDDEEDLGIYVGEVNPNSIAAKDGRIREGDRILQINGVDIQNREEAVAILTREDSTNISLLLARPEIENDNQLDPDELELELQVGMGMEALDNASHLPSPQRQRKGGSRGGAGRGGVGGASERRGRVPFRDTPSLRHTVLSNSQELDSGVGRTDESTRNEESSEHDLLGDEQTSASNTNATNTPGSMRKFRPGRGDTPPLLHSREFHFSTDSLLGLDCGGGGGERGGGSGGGGGYILDPVVMMMPGLTEEECERYRELLEIKCYYEKNGNALLTLGAERGRGEGGGRVPLDMNRNESLMQHEMALLEEELRHLEFKCRNILRAQKMQQLRERCMKAWPLEEEGAGAGLGVGGAARTPPTMSCRTSPSCPRGSGQTRTAPAPITPAGRAAGAPRWHRDRGQVNLNRPYSPNGNRKYEDAGGRTSPTAATKFRSLSRDGVARRGSEGAMRRSPKGSGTLDRGGGRSAETSPYFSRRHRLAKLPERYQSCMQLRSASASEGLAPVDCAEERGGRAVVRDNTSGDLSPMSIGSSLNPAASPRPDSSPAPLLLPPPPPLPPTSPRMEWKVKVRSDGSRYVAKRPVRDRLLKARAMKIREERSGMTTDDDAVSEMKMGRYWSKEERKQQLMRAREYRRRREFMMQSRLDCLREKEQQQGSADGKGGQQGPPQEASILELSQRKSMKKRSRRILDNWITIQELLAHGTRSPDGKKVYNPLLSVTTV
ncbi:hypothetical protein AAFF_G00142230 [Aldrovandia affinis]|uniref:PDZ domain-containing protein n=1 Tax=Aldrovandia affinis TaxID=143900 RepID=A0AAD7WWA9_9TELE|nr:hypothetical protein AAFF_G00142230 [Aldrovandia affinis]